MHISYKLEIKVWRARSAEQKLKILERKNRVQAEFRDKMGLLVDKPGDGGSGTSNDGNTARTFCSNPSLASEITGVDENLIIRCATILQALASGYTIDVKKFEAYAFDTAERLIKIYPWYYLPDTLHKI